MRVISRKALRQFWEIHPAAQRPLQTHAGYDKERWKMIRGMAEQSTDYRTLLQTFIPRPIHDEVQYDMTVVQLSSLIDRGALTQAEAELLDLLGTLVAAYEEEHYSDADLPCTASSLCAG